MKINNNNNSNNNYHDNNCNDDNNAKNVTNHRKIHSNNHVKKKKNKNENKNEKKKNKPIQPCPYKFNRTSSHDLNVAQLNRREIENYHARDGYIGTKGWLHRDKEMAT